MEGGGGLVAMAPPPPQTDRLILCTLYIPVECSEEGLLGGEGGLLGDSDIYYIPVIHTLRPST
jgi:hypothetical protein